MLYVFHVCVNVKTFAHKYGIDIIVVEVEGILVKSPMFLKGGI